MREYNRANTANARTLRRNMTPWERKLWYRFLKGHTLRWQRQTPIGDYIVDFYCAKARLAVELDGSGHYETEQQLRDELRTRNLQEQGVTVARFANNQVDRMFDAVCGQIDRIVKERVESFGTAK
ncbi:endonuclease domain-containing protein [Bifidobacterium amazonense]|uniref:Endonuclease domain-containing protein n=1 Tax=Bifidobacterium amazonense TaxID=2809027 RepID=A0ABS9VUP6_9BIFI|nr:endonuclease domain-containing protein [Bifidobacterium amazonense]MCH9275540.1 endonuclease domain-containing protein [Bifidobacterium amazonense]